jgi:molybdate transport system substrate-binding protein
MKTISIKSRTFGLAVAGILLAGDPAWGAEIRVLVSGAFTAPYLQIVPEFERMTGNKLVTSSGLVSVENVPGSIPDRLQRGESVDIVILSGDALDQLIQQGKVIPGSRVDLVRSSIGVAVRAGAPKPDIHSVDALKRTLLNAKSIAYSSSVSGVYVSTELFRRLGIADQARGKSKRIEGMVGTAVARGDTEIGIQQISELLAAPGIDYLGPLPSEIQRVTVFSAGIAVGSKEPDAARSLIRFLASPAAVPAIMQSGLEPVTSR